MKKTEYIPIGKYTAANRNALPLYNAAVKILSMPTSERRPEIAKHETPELLAEEVTRIWTLRRQ